MLLAGNRFGIKESIEKKRGERRCWLEVPAIRHDETPKEIHLEISVVAAEFSR